MNIIFPIAGFGTRFSENGYLTLKPFINVKGMPIIEYAISSLKIKGTYHLITRPLIPENQQQLLEIIDKYAINAVIHTILEPTKGAAETCLSIEKEIDSEQPLVITNGDQFTPWDSTKFIKFIQDPDIDAVVSVYDYDDVILGADSPYSFVKLDDKGYAIEFAEKKAISKNSLNGIHYWKRAGDFFDSAKQLLKDENCTQEKYISLTFNYLLKHDKKILTYKMQPDEFYAMGTPDEIKKNLLHLNF